MLNSHTWLLARVSDSADTGHFHHHINFYWTVLVLSTFAISERWKDYNPRCTWVSHTRVVPENLSFAEFCRIKWYLNTLRRLIVYLKGNQRDFPGGPVVETPCFYCRGHGFDPWLRTKIPHASPSSQKKTLIFSLPISSPHQSAMALTFAAFWQALTF